MQDQLETIFWKGQELEIVPSSRESYFTEIVESDPHLFIQRPVNSKHSPLTLIDETTVTVYFYDDDKTLYTFDALLQHVNNKTFWVETPSTNEIKKAQRRRFFRIQVAVDVKLIVPSMIQNVLDVSTYDLSGGGLSFISEHNIAEEETKLKGKLSLVNNGKQDVINFHAKTVRAHQLENGMYHNAVTFIDLGEKKRTKIIQFCMAKQIELRNKLRGR